MAKLEKFVKVMQAIGWTLFVITFLAIFYLIAMVLLRSNRFDRIGVQERVVSQPTEKDKFKKKIITFAQPVITEYSDYIMIPVGQRLISEENLTSRSSRSGIFGSSYQTQYSSEFYSYSLSGADYNNILFVKKDGSGSYLLFDKKIAITDFYYPYEKIQKEDGGIINFNFLLFGLVKNDYDKDGFLTDDDAVVLHISDSKGEDLKALTPENAQFLRWDFDKKRNSIYIEYREDSNNDNNFNILDQTYMIEVDTDKKMVKSILIDKEIINKVKSIVF